MSHCNDCRVQMTLYLDNELGAAERAAFVAHLHDCAACREICQRERWLRESVRRAHPLPVAPSALRARITTQLAAIPPQRRRLFARINSVSGGLAALLLVLVGVWGGLFTLETLQTQASSEFALMAVDAHQRHRHGQLPLELVTDSPTTISHWFDGKVPFGLTLPNYQEVSGQNKLYRLEGARLVGFRQDYAAYVAYQMAQRPISLVVTSSVVAQPTGGRVIVSKGLAFHYDTIAGFKVITWSHRGLTYALVSDFDAPGQQSCLVCHQGAQDRDFLDGLTVLPTSPAHR